MLAGVSGQPLPFMSEKQYGVVGFPLGHSLSPLLHNHAFVQYDWSGRYERFAVAPPEFAAFMREVRSRPVHGLSVTLPYKQQVMSYLDRLTPLARQTGAVNTVFWKENELWGDNTDVAGFLSPLLALPVFPASAIVLGAGGAARAVVSGLLSHGCQVTVCARNAAKGQALAREFGTGFLAWERQSEARADLLVNTTPLGMTGTLRELSPWSGCLEHFSLVYDLIYTPSVTPFLAKARQAGCQTLNGQTMFAVQAACQFFLWTGRKMNEKKVLEFVIANTKE